MANFTKYKLKLIAEKKEYLKLQKCQEKSDQELLMNQSIS